MQQLFKAVVPPNILWDFLHTQALAPIQTHAALAPSVTTYTFTKHHYKVAMFRGLLQPWLLALKPYYHVSKQHYVDRPMTYFNFLTVLRQLCHAQKEASYTTDKLYADARYEIVYHFQKAPEASEMPEALTVPPSEMPEASEASLSAIVL
jgi:hypothetical protein